MNPSMDAILELLEQNSRWWEQAAKTCEQVAANGMGSKEEWQLMGAVYRERAQKHFELLDQTRQTQETSSGD